MIIQERGRWRTERTPEEQISVARDLTKELNPKERAAFDHLLKQLSSGNPSLLVDEIAKVDWVEVPMPIEEWINSEDMIGDNAKSMFPKLKEDIVRLFRGNYHEVVLTGSIGWGKDYFACFCIMRLLYELCCMKNPARTLGLGAGEQIHIAPVSRTVELAKRVVFSGLAQKLRLAPWFKGRFHETMDYIQFREKGILLVGGSSSDTSILGLNILAAILDECVTGDTEILTPTGYKRLDSLSTDGLTLNPIMAYDEVTQEVKASNGYIKPSSVAEVIEIELSDGRCLRATDEHPVLVRDGNGERFVFIRDLAIGDRVVCTDEVVRQEWRTELVLRTDAYFRGADQDVRSCGCPTDGWQAQRGDQAEASANNHPDLGDQVRNRCDWHSGQCIDPVRRCRQGDVAAEGTNGQSSYSGATARGGQSAGRDVEGYLDARASEGARCALLTSPPYSGIQSQNRCGEQQEERGLQALTGSSSEDERAQRLEVEERGLPLSWSCRDGEGRTLRVSLLVGAAGDRCVGDRSSDQLILLRKSSGPLHLERAAAKNRAGLPGDASHRINPRRRGEAVGLREESKGAGEGGSCSRLLRGTGVALRDMDRGTTVARIVSKRSAGRCQTYEVMSDPFETFIANGIVVHNCNFHGAPKRKDITAGSFNPSKAQMIYDALVRRVKSRYERSGVKGMVFLISSKRATTDFTEQRIRESMKTKTDRGLFVMDYATWHVRPEPFKDQEWHRAVLSPSDGRVSILDKSEPDPVDGLVFDFPHDYLSEFQRDPIGATRDVAGLATDAVAPFIPDRDAIDEMFTEDMPIAFGTHTWRMDQELVIKWDDVRMQNARGEHIPICCASSPRHVHIDLSKNQCATGWTMGHQAGTTEVKRPDPESGKMVTEEVPVIHIDGILRILAPQGGSIDHSMVRNLVYRFIEAGFYVRSVSMDQWMSVPNEQAFEKRGLKTEVISTVRTLDPYLAARGAVIERRIKSPPSPVLKNEIIWLELDSSGRKIVAPPNGCFTGDTEVRLLDGRSRSFVELVAEFGNGKPFYVYTIRGGLVSVGTARNPRLTKHATELVEVVLDNGRRIRCTPDHRFMMRGGSYLEAEQLQVGDSLMPLYTSVSTRKTRGGLIGYELFMCPSDDRWHFTHRMVGRWKYPDFGYTGNQYGNGIIHHKRGKLNNDPDALEWCADSRAHGLEHRDDLIVKRANPVIEARRIHGHKLYYERGGSEEQADRIRAMMQNPDWVERRRKASAETGRRTGPENLRSYNKSEAHRRVASEVGRRTIRHAVEAFARRDITPEVVMELRAQGLRNKEIAQKLNCSVSVVERRVRFAKTGVPRNHKVLSVQRIAQSADVYDLTVDETENFALSSGVFVHNSKDVADSWAGAVYYITKNATGGVPMTITGGKEPQPFKPPVRLVTGGEIRWADEDEEEEAAKEDTGGFGSFIIR